MAEMLVAPTMTAGALEAVGRDGCSALVGGGSRDARRRTEPA